MVKDKIAAEAIKRQKEREKDRSKVDVPDGLIDSEEPKPKTTDKQKE